MHAISFPQLSFSSIPCHLACMSVLFWVPCEVVSWPKASPWRWNKVSLYPFTKSESQHKMEVKQLFGWKQSRSALFEIHVPDDSLATVTMPQAMPICHRNQDNTGGVIQPAPLYGAGGMYTVCTFTEWAMYILSTFHLAERMCLKVDSSCCNDECFLRSPSQYHQHTGLHPKPASFSSYNGVCCIGKPS